MLANPKIAPIPSRCPKLVVASTAGKPIPPNIAGEGIAGGELGRSILYLPIAIAMMLQIIIVIATWGLHSGV